MSNSIINRNNALQLDDQDNLAAFRDQFLFPQHEGKQAIYLCGNSLGLQPKGVKNEILDILSNWSNRGVEGHFEGDKNWIDYINQIKPNLAPIVGAHQEEIVVMNTVTVNLHLMMISFYRPTEKRYKIIIEQDAFPSDIYAVKSQLRYHGLDPEKDLIIVSSKNNNPLLSLDDWEETLHEHGDETALLIAGGINYYSGQWHDMEAITRLAKNKGIHVGWDLAHCVGNVPLKLHDWNVDFAVWCHYKYLNAGPGAIAGAFVHSNHHDSDLPRFEGWWGNQLSTRFKMADTFDPAVGTEAWAMSTPPTLSIAPLRVALELVQKAGFENIITKSKQLSNYLISLVENIGEDHLKIITPKSDSQRGSQISIQIKNGNKSIFDKIIQQGVICDWREPDVIRLAPNAIYNSYSDIYDTVEIIKRIIS